MYLGFHFQIHTGVVTPGKTYYKNRLGKMRVNQWHVQHIESGVQVLQFPPHWVWLLAPTVSSFAVKPLTSGSKSPLLVGSRGFCKVYGHHPQRRQGFNIFKGQEIQFSGAEHIKAGWIRFCNCPKWNLIISVHLHCKWLTAKPLMGGVNLPALDSRWGPEGAASEAPELQEFTRPKNFILRGQIWTLLYLWT